MKLRQIALLVQAAAILVVGGLLIIAADARARSNTATAFASYQPSWPDAWRAPVEHQALAVLGRLLSTPERDAELARAAMGVMRQSVSWPAMLPDLRNQARAVLLARMGDGNDQRLRVAWELFALCDPEDLEEQRARIIALGGDRTAEAEALSRAAERLQAAEVGDSPGLLSAVEAAWEALIAPRAGRELPWLARLGPVIAGAEQVARAAVLHHRRVLLEPFGLRRDANHGGRLPDRALLDWLDTQARAVTQRDPAARQRLEQAQSLIDRHLVDAGDEPVVTLGTRIALRHHTLPWSAVMLGTGVLLVLIVGVIHALVRLRRGPLPIDANAETMENVEPIDLDTDAETRSRSSAAITDVG
jgi:hypothetical protein